MNRIFKPRRYFTVPDGTGVSAFLNATDVTQEDVPWDALGEMSIASGRIGPRVHSWVHTHPAVTQVTYLNAGELTIRMKDPTDTEPYDLELQAGQAVVSQPGTLFQLRNDSEANADVLYIVSPSYVFEMEGDEVQHDDAILVARTWEELVAADYEVPALEVSAYEARSRRAESKRRLALKKGHGPRALAKEDIKSLDSEYDYLAPDGSEIRLLVGGEHGGFAHCFLPAGKISAPVAHRTVEELWYVLEGVGEIWRARDGEARTDAISRGDSFRIPVGTSFQFRASAASDLKLLLATMPPWPGSQEAVPAKNRLWA
jgi:mannose-6-phosphate isomerase-like protein (cupin superfamily)